MSEAAEAQEQIDAFIEDILNTERPSAESFAGELSRPRSPGAYCYMLATASKYFADSGYEPESELGIISARLANRTSKRGGVHTCKDAEPRFLQSFEDIAQDFRFIRKAVVYVDQDGSPIAIQKTRGEKSVFTTAASDLGPLIIGQVYPDESGERFSTKLKKVVVERVNPSDIFAKRVSTFLLPDSIRARQSYDPTKQKKLIPHREAAKVIELDEVYAQIDDMITRAGI